MKRAPGAGRKGNLGAAKSNGKRADTQINEHGAAAIPLAGADSAYGLDPEEERFAREYIKEFNASRAARAAKPSLKSRDSVRYGYNMVRRPRVLAAIKRMLSELWQQEEISAQMVVRDLALLAFYDPGSLIKWHPGEKDKFTGEWLERPWAELKGSEDLSQQERKLLRSIKVVRNLKTGEAIGLEATFYDRLAALDKLAMHFRLYDSTKNDDGKREEEQDDSRNTIRHILDDVASKIAAAEDEKHGLNPYGPAQPDTTDQEGEAQEEVSESEEA